MKTWTEMDFLELARAIAHGRTAVTYLGPPRRHVVYLGPAAMVEQLAEVRRALDGAPPIARVSRPPLPPPREIREGEVPPRLFDRPRLSSETPRPLRCLLGLHDWRRRSTKRACGDLIPGAAGPLLGEMVTVRFEQCRRCDKTRDGMYRFPSLADGLPLAPAPLPWDDGEG